MDDAVQMGKQGHFVSDSDDEEKARMLQANEECHEEKTTNQTPGGLWSKALQDGDLESMMAAPSTSLHDQTLNDRGPESYNFDFGKKFAEDVFGEPPDLDKAETFGVDESRLRKRKHPQLEAYPPRQEPQVPQVNRKLQFKSPAGIYGDSDDDDESPSKRLRGRQEAPPQHSETAIGDDEQGNEWRPPVNSSEVRMFSVQATRTEGEGSGDDEEEWKPMQQMPMPSSLPAVADRPRKPPIPNDKKFCPRNMLRDDYTLTNLLNTTIPPEMDDIYEIGEKMAAALGDLKPDTIMEYAVKLGKERALEVFRQTQEKEKNGGMNVTSNYRRRTPGGVFLYFAREILEPADAQSQKIDDGRRNKDDEDSSERSG